MPVDDLSLSTIFSQVTHSSSQTDVQEVFRRSKTQAIEAPSSLQMLLKDNNSSNHLL